MNILVVDDEEVIVLGILKRIQKLRDVYVNIVGAYSGEEALTIMEDFIPDLVITDIQMPDMSGLELIAKIRGRDISNKIIILTAHEEFEYARQGLKYHVDDYLLKPIDWDVLEKYIRGLATASATSVQVDDILAEYAHRFHAIDCKSISTAMKKILKYINANFSHEISLTHLSVYTGMSESNICNIFKKELNMTFLDYVYELRLKKAIELLTTDPEKTMRDIAAMVGYRSERQFFRLFKNNLGVTPQQLKNRYYDN